jgi:hypothetical protein
MGLQPRRSTGCLRENYPPFSICGRVSSNPSLSWMVIGVHLPGQSIKIITHQRRHHLVGRSWSHTSPLGFFENPEMGHNFFTWRPIFLHERLRWW